MDILHNLTKLQRTRTHKLRYLHREHSYVSYCNSARHLNAKHNLFVRIFLFRNYSSRKPCELTFRPIHYDGSWRTVLVEGSYTMEQFKIGVFQRRPKVHNYVRSRAAKVGKWFETILFHSLLEMLAKWPRFLWGKGKIFLFKFY